MTEHCDCGMFVKLRQEPCVYRIEFWQVGEEASTVLTWAAGPHVVNTVMLCAYALRDTNEIDRLIVRDVNDDVLFALAEEYSE